MDQNQTKSVWLRLILPICLGVFATAIYHNAIKTQRITVNGFEATETIQFGVIEAKVLKERLEEKHVTLHRQSPESLKASFTKKNVETVIESSSKLIANREISKGEFVTIYDIRPAN